MCVEMYRHVQLTKNSLYLYMFMERNLIGQVKGLLCSFREEIQTQSVNIYNINDEKIQSQKCFHKAVRIGIKVPRTLFEERKAAGIQTERVYLFDPWLVTAQRFTLTFI